MKQKNKNYKNLNLSNFYKIIDKTFILSKISEFNNKDTPINDAKKIIFSEIFKINDLGREEIKKLFFLNPFSGSIFRELYSTLTDTIISLTVETSIKIIHRLPNPTKYQKLSVLAVGGYGRNEMAPFSDIDLLFLTPYKQTAWGESVIETILYTLWDLKFKVGYSVRTIEECTRLGKNDIKVRTSLLEKRFLYGDKEMEEQLDKELKNELFKNTFSEFLEAKLKERSERHFRQGGSRYVLEPNVKEGKGSLRDLQTLYWILKYLYGNYSKNEYIENNVFNEEELKKFSQAENFLWSIRCALHLISNRAEEHLNFNNQIEVTKKLNYKASKGLKAVEVFMKEYFYYAKIVGDLTRIFLASLEEKHLKNKPDIGQNIRNILEYGFGYKKNILSEPFTIKHGRLNISKNEDFLNDRINLLKLFHYSSSFETLIHPNALRLVASNLKLIDKNFKKNKEANDFFLEILIKYNNPEKILRSMNEVGFLGAFIPEFGRIVGLMQFNMYHSYTVDEHSIQCIRELSEIQRGLSKKDLPLASKLIEEDINKKVLFISLLFHDIGKGLPNDHSEIGGEIVKKILPRFNLKPEESDQIIWLIKNHLLMSDTAQKRDLSDNQTIKTFSNQVTTVTRLKLLTLLTVCDIRGVSNKAWNNWKAVLLRELYSKTFLMLTEDSMSFSKKSKIDEIKKIISDKLVNWTIQEKEKALSKHYDSFWITIDTNTQIEFLNLIKNNKKNEISISLNSNNEKDANRLCFVSNDHPGLFSKIAGALSFNGANIVDARTFTSKNGFVTAVFWIQDIENKPFSSEMLSRFRKTIQLSIDNKLFKKKEYEEKNKIKKKEKDFVVPTTISFDNTGSEVYTIIEVDTRDRMGLIYDLCRTLTNNNILIHSAKIVTYGEQAVDTFYVKDIFGLKISNKFKQNKISQSLREAIDIGSRKALK